MNSQTKISEGKKRPRPEWKNNDKDHQPPLLLSPHTNRLLKLVEEGTAEHARLAAAQLSTIAAASSPTILWELLGRLQAFLTCSDWTTRMNASTALTNVASHIPPLDQEAFLKQTFTIEEESNTNNNLWLTLEDFKQNNTTTNNTDGLEQILSNGRILLAASESKYDDEELQQLVKLDASQQEIDDFVQRRVELQRRILAQRLGLSSSMVDAIIGTDACGLPDTITKDDLLLLLDDDPAARQRQHMERIRRKQQEKNEQDDDTKSSIRTLLVMEMRAQQQTPNNLSHKNPQTLLATELIFRMFDANWHVRHGALVGTLAILKAWNRNNDSAFGVWPQDIMARCLCVLALDRFGDYGSAGGTGVVAPVREQAAQLLSVLWSMAPETTRTDCLDVLFRLGSYKQEWEVRHGAMLGIKYIVALLLSQQKVGYRTDHTLTETVRKIADAGLAGISDDMDDVKAVAAQVLSCVFDKAQNLGDISYQIIKGSCLPLMKALENMESVSTSPGDLIMLFASILSHSWITVIQTITPSLYDYDKCRIKEGARILDMFARVLETSESLSVRKSALEAIAKVAHGGFFDVLRPDKVLDASPMVNSLCRLLEIVFGTFLPRSYTGLPGINEVEFRHKYDLQVARDEAWYELVCNCGELLSAYSLLRNHLLLTIFRAYFGLPDPSRGISAESARSLFGCQPRAAMALIQLLSAVVGVDQRIDYLLKMSLIAFINSPWCHFFEAACILFEKICFMESAEIFAVTFSSVLKSLKELLVDLPRCLRANTTSVSDDHIVVACAMEWSTCATNCLAASSRADLQAKDAELLARWDAVFDRNGVTFDKDADSNSQGIGGIKEMRIRATIAGSIVAAGREHLPEKLTPIIRPLMTSIKNETEDERSDFIISSYMQKLFEILNLDAFDGRRVSVRDKLLDKMCVLACSDTSSTDSGSEATTASAATWVVRSVIGGYLVLPNSSLESLSAIWDRLVPILRAAADGMFDEVTLTQSLCMLDIVCSSSIGGEWPRLIGTAGPSLVLIACTCSFSSARNLSTKILAFMWYMFSFRAQEVILPVMMKYLEDRGNDAYRYGACQLLHAILDRVRSFICPCIRALLPRAMTLMVDPVLEISREAAQCFAILVRLAPFVPKSEHRRPAEDSGGGDSTTHVIDHLIHGKPLPPVDLPEVLKKEAELSGIEPRHYQLEGISWLEFLRSVSLNGALCDDMGLGKTVQSLIAIASCHLQSPESDDGSIPVSLIVCPSSLINHWVAEIRKFFPSGTVLSGRAYTSKDKGQLIDVDGKSNIIVTSYSVLRRDISKFVKKTWKYCVLDEGHLLKNPKTATAIAVRKIHSEHRLILTGTPVQNRVQELWAAFDFLMPNFLGTHSSFMKEFGRPIAKGQALGASATDIKEGMDKLKLLHQQVLPFILRREKQQVLSELPPKAIMDIPCGLSGLQESIYRKFCEQSSVRESIDALQRALSETLQRPEESKSSVGRNALASLLYLRLLCTHPVLVKSRSWKDELLAGKLVGDYARLDSSGKLVVLSDLLRSSGIADDALTGADNDVSALYVESNSEDASSSQLDPEDLLSEGEGAVFEVSSGVTRKESPKCLIFAQFTQSLDVVEEFLFRRQMPSLRYLRLDGSVPVDKRGNLVEAFNTDDSIKVMLLTSKVGGLGLNLTGASIVIFLEHDYNPHSDLQAMDRAHRIGQTKTVNVYRLVTQNTIEEKIMKLQEAKMAMSKAIVNTENSSMFSMGTDRLLDIFTFQSDKPTETNDNDGESPSLDALGELYDTDEYESLSVEEFVRSFRDGTT